MHKFIYCSPCSRATINKRASLRVDGSQSVSLSHPSILVVLNPIPPHLFCVFVPDSPITNSTNRKVTVLPSLSRLFETPRVTVTGTTGETFNVSVLGRTNVSIRPRRWIPDTLELGHWIGERRESKEETCSPYCYHHGWKIPTTLLIYSYI